MKRNKKIWLSQLQTLNSDYFHLLLFIEFLIQDFISKRAYIGHRFSKLTTFLPRKSEVPPFLYNACMLGAKVNIEKRSSHDKPGKVHIFWEGHKILRNLHLTFVCMYLLTVNKSKAKISKSFVAFSKYTNFSCDALQWKETKSTLHRHNVSL